MTASVMVNGHLRPLDTGATVATVVAELASGRPTAGVAVAVNNEVVPRAAWDATVLAPDDRVEVLTAMQGG